MPTYVSLMSWTEQGVKNYKTTVERAAAAEAAMAKVGMRMKDLYWTQGTYDIVAISEAPDEETAAAFMLALASEGNLRSTTLTAFDRDAMSRIVAKLG
jgi:uncharacterized protein with GYD domain